MGGSGERDVDGDPRRASDPEGAASTGTKGMGGCCLFIINCYCYYLSYVCLGGGAPLRDVPETLSHLFPFFCYVCLPSRCKKKVAEYTLWRL